MSRAFETEDPRLQGFTLVPAKPTLDMDISEIKLNATRYNGLMFQMMHQTIHGIKEIDMKMETRTGGTMTLRDFLQGYWLTHRGIY